MEFSHDESGNSWPKNEKNNLVVHTCKANGWQILTLSPSSC